MSNQIRLKRGSGSAPSASDLVVGEVALRTDTGQLFTKKDDGNVEEIGAQGGVSDGDRGDITVSNSGATFTIDNGVITSAKILDGTITGSDLATNVDLVDNQKLRLGTGNDLEIYHDSNNSFIKNSGGGLYIQGNGVNSLQLQPKVNEQSVTCRPDNAVELYYDNSKKFETTSTGALLGDHTVAAVNTLSKGVLDLGAQYSNTDGTPKLFIYNDTNAYFGFGVSSNQLDVCLSSSNFDFVTYQGTTELFRVEGTGNGQIPADNKKLQIGASQDLEIYHDGTNSVIDNNTGRLELSSTGNVIIKPGDKKGIILNEDASVELYFNDFKKFETTSVGATVTGGLTTSGQTVINHNNLIVSGTSPNLFLTDTNNDSDYKLTNNEGQFIIFDVTNTATRLAVNADGHVDIAGNVDFGAGIDVTGEITGTSHIDIPDGAKIKLGTGDDLNIFHDGSNSYLQNITGNLILKNNATDFIRFINSDASTQVVGNLDVGAGLDVTGNISVTGTVDGVDIAARDTLFGSLISSSATLTDGVIATTQSAGDSSTKVATTAFVSTAVSNLVDSAPGTLNTLNELAAALGDDANFSTTVTNSIATKLPLAGGTLTGNLLLGDSVEARFGAGSDLKIYHDGSGSYIDDSSGTGELILKSNSISFTNAAENEYLARFFQDGAVNLYHNGSKKFETTSYGAAVTGGINFSGDSLVQDNVSIFFGAGNDLGIKHDGSNSFVDNSTGDIYFRNTATNGDCIIQAGAGGHVYLRPNAGENGVIANTNGAVELYYDNSKKLETTSSGVTVTGSIVGVVSAANTNLLHYTANMGTNNNRTFIIKAPATDSTAQPFSFNTANAFEFNVDTARTLFIHESGEVRLHHDGSTDAKLSTSSSGINVSGNLTATGSSATLKVSESGGATGEIRAGGATVYVGTESNHNLSFISNNTVRMVLTNSGHLNPNVDSTYNLGSNSYRWANVYADTLYGDGSNLTGINTDLVSDTTPQLGGNLQTNNFFISFADNTSGLQNKALFGNNNDLQIYHNGTNSFIENSTGILYIRDTSGGDVRIQGKAGEESIICNDDGAVEIYHDNVKVFNTDTNGIFVYGPENGSANIYLYADEGDDNADKFQLTVNNGGPFLIQNRKANGNVETNIECNGDGNVELYYDNSKKFETKSGGVQVHGDLMLDSDSDKAIFGASNDLQIYHDGSSSNIYNSTGSLVFRSDAYYLNSQNGSETLIKGVENGAVELYHNNIKQLETDSGGIIVTDNDTTSYVNLTTTSGNAGYLYASGSTQLGLLDGDGSWMVKAIKDAAVELYHDNNKKFETQTNGITVTGGVYSDGLICGDSEMVELGNSGDLKIYHDGSDSIIKGTGTGSLILESAVTNEHVQAKAGVNGDFRAYVNNGTLAIICNAATQNAELRCGGSKKLETTSSGVEVTGTLTVNGAAILTAADFPSIGTKITATGGSTSTVSGHKVHDFTSSGTFEITAGTGEVEVLVVGGGGSEGGGNSGCHGGGGGGGGGVFHRFITLGVGKYQVTIGGGGGWRSNGGDSRFFSIRALGGGAGGPSLTGHGNSGGSGGGASRHTTSNQGGSSTQLSQVLGGLGNAGGNIGSNTNPGGGGGAGGVGQSGNTSETNPGRGGPGVQFTQFGVNTYFGAGGNGNGGGSDAGPEGQTGTSNHGAANTGAGGGGSSGGGTRFSGGSGRVMVRYAT